MIWIALATAEPPPLYYTPDTRGLFRADDYPKGALMRGEQGSVITRLVVNPAGRVESCTIVYSSHSTELDRATCNLIETRARFKPATHDGIAIYAVMLSPPITWSLGGLSRQMIVPKPDVELDISRAPAGVSLPIDVRVDYIVDAGGKIVSCDGTSPNAPAALIAVACDAANLPPTEVLRNNKGTAVDAIFSAKVRFELGKR